MRLLRSSHWLTCSCGCDFCSAAARSSLAGASHVTCMHSSHHSLECQFAQGNRDCCQSHQTQSPGMICHQGCASMAIARCDTPVAVVLVPPKFGRLLSSWLFRWMVVIIVIIWQTLLHILLVCVHPVVLHTACTHVCPCVLGRAQPNRNINSVCLGRQ